MEYKRSRETKIARPDTTQRVVVSLNADGHVAISLVNNVGMRVDDAKRVIVLLEAAIAEAERFLSS